MTGYALLAGFAGEVVLAECLAAHGIAHTATKTFSGNDYTRATAALAKASGPCDSLTEIEADAPDMVRHYWDSIDNLAQHLIQTRRVDFLEIDDYLLFEQS